MSTIVLALLLLLSIYRWHTVIIVRLPVSAQNRLRLLKKLPNWSLNTPSKIEEIVRNSDNEEVTEWAIIYLSLELNCKEPEVSSRLFYDIPPAHKAARKLAYLLYIRGKLETSEDFRTAFDLFFLTEDTELYLGEILADRLREEPELTMTVIDSAILERELTWKQWLSVYRLLFTSLGGGSKVSDTIYVHGVLDRALKLGISHQRKRIIVSKLHKKLEERLVKRGIKKE